MAMQQQNSSFAARLGARVAAANAEHKDKPVDLGNRRLPGGIRNGIAKLSAMYTKQQTEENGMVPKGSDFFRASAVVLSPESHNGEKVAGMITQQLVPLCDIPAKGLRKATTFGENWYDFQNLFKLLKIDPPDEKGQDEAAGKRIEAYYFAAMKALTDPKNPPVYISFSTRGWTPPATAAQPKPTEMVFEEWHGLATPDALAALNGQAAPGAGVVDRGAGTSATAINPATVQPEPFSEPPQGAVDPRSLPNNAVIHGMSPDAARDTLDEVAVLIETARGDPEGATEDGAAATARLEEMAWANGWTKEQTGSAADWSEVGEMALGGPDEEPAPIVNSTWKFAKRSKEGAKLKNNKGVEFPPLDVVVATVDAATKTCTLKTTDGKDVVDIRTKAPIPVKWEWLES